MYEPASTMPTGIWGVRITEHLHRQYNTIGHREMFTVLYGMAPQLSLSFTAVYSNFNLDYLPQDLNLYFNTYHHHKSTSARYPYGFDGIYASTKFRVVTIDGKNRHFRIAGFGEVGLNQTNHMDAYPSLKGDHSGLGIGLILTLLNKRFAGSLSISLNEFFERSGTIKSDFSFKPGRAYNLAMSMGYLVLPRSYTSYKNLNLTVYFEVLCKKYANPVVSRQGYFINYEQFEYLRAGFWIRGYPGIQLIFNSKLRFDLSLEHQLYSSNSLEGYSMLILSLQRYFY